MSSYLTLEYIVYFFLFLVFSTEKSTQNLEQMKDFQTREMNDSKQLWPCSLAF